MSDNSLYFHLIDGSGFFSGCGLLVAVVAIRWRWRSKAARYAASALLWIAVALVTVSATPLPVWLYWLGGVCIAAALGGDAELLRLSNRAKRLVRSAAILTVVVWVVAEAPFALAPSLPDGRFPLLQVIGDSLSAPVGKHEHFAWPNRLGHEHDVEVANLAVPAERVAGALKQADRLRPGPSVVLLEIGGNDIIAPEPTPEPQYEARLEALLQQSAAPDRLVVMFELPTLPFRTTYGRIQRRLARQYEVVLLPKRCLLSVIRVPGNTTDGIHLTDQGHQAMADLVWRILGPSLAPNPDD